MKKVIFTEKAPAAIGPYSQAIEANGMIFLSGQLPVDPATGEFAPGGVAEQTTQCFENIKNVLAEAGLTTANIVKTTVFLADMSLFAEMNAVYATYFEGDFPARSAFRPVNTELALLTEAATGITADLLLRMQTRYDRIKAENKPDFMEKLKKIRKFAAAL